jgi:hypothetical protein
VSQARTFIEYGTLEVEQSYERSMPQSFEQTMSDQSKLPLVGVLLFALSFFLIAVGPGRGDLAIGFVCAYFTLQYSVLGAKALLHPSASAIAHYFSYSVSGWINPFFLLNLRKPTRTVRNLLLAMMPFCWVVFYDENLFPREGYFLWTLGMLLTLFSIKSPVFREGLTE